MEDTKDIMRREMEKEAEKSGEGLFEKQHVNRPRQDWIPTPSREPTTDELLIEMESEDYDPMLFFINGAWECRAYYTDEYDEEHEFTVSGETPQKACLAMRQVLKDAVARSEREE